MDAGLSKDRVLAVHTGQIHALCLPDRVNQPSASTSAVTSPSTSNEPGSLPADTDTTRVAESNEQGRDEPEGAEKPSPSQQPDAVETVEVVSFFSMGLIASLKRSDFLSPPALWPF